MRVSRDGICPLKMFGNFVLSDELQRVSGFYFFPNETFHDSFCGEIEGYFLKEFVSYYSGEHRFCEEDADESVGGVKEEGGADDFCASMAVNGGFWMIVAWGLRVF